MSCDNNRTRFFQHVIARVGTAGGVTVGDLESLYQAKRGMPADELTAVAARAKTHALFLSIELAGFKPPSHAADGLPRPQSQLGYAAVYDFLHGRGWLAQGVEQPMLAMASAPQPVTPTADAAIPEAARTMAQQALSRCPELTLLAVDAYTFKKGQNGLRDFDTLLPIALAWEADTNLPQRLRDAAKAFHAYHRVPGIATTFAEVICETAGLQRCPKCLYFKDQTIVAHTCPSKKQTYNQNGYDSGGYNRMGYDKDGFGGSGRDREGYDRNGFKDGYNRRGYDSNGYDKHGRDYAGYNTQGVDKQGYNRWGYKPDGQQTMRDRDGYDLSGYDASGYDRNGYDREGKDRAGSRHPGLKPDARGVYPDGLDAWGFPPDGYNAQGRDRYGFDRTGYNQQGYDRNGLNKKGLTADGLDHEGYDSRGFKVGTNRVKRNRAGYDEDGFDEQGFTATGYDRNGLDRTGQPRMIRDKKNILVEPKYSKGGWDRQGYDRWGYNRKTGLTEPDEQGVQRNPLGWIYDAATNECYDPSDPSYRVPHIAETPPSKVSSFVWDRKKKRVLLRANGYYGMPNALPQLRTPVPSPPITPHADMTQAEFRRSLGPVASSYYGNVIWELDETARVTYPQIQKPTLDARWPRMRAAFDPQACKGGILLRCPQCGRFTLGEAHACPNFPQVRQVIVYQSGMVKSGNLILAVPSDQGVIPYKPGGYGSDGFDDASYDRQGYNRSGWDRQGYNREGYDVFGYDRQGYDRQGYNRQGVDRDGKEKPKTLREAAKQLDDGINPLNNEHLENLYSRLCSGLVGQSRRVFLRPGSTEKHPVTGAQVYRTSGFATDMRGTIQADPTPLGPTADPRDNLVVTRAGLYHELGHELYTPPELWAAVLEAHKSTTPVNFETSTGGTLTLDAGRRFLPRLYNLVEDGRMEREVARATAGAGEILAASCRLEERWTWEPGRRPDDLSDLEGVLLYEALPFYRVLPLVVEERLSPRARRLFEELQPLVHQAVRGSADDAFNAAVLIAKRLEDEGLINHDEAWQRGMTPPPPPPPGTQARRPKIIIGGDQVIDASQPGSSGGAEFDVEFTGHVTIKNADASGDQQSGGQAIFSGGVTFEGSQPQDQQNGQQNGQPGSQGGRQPGSQGGDQPGSQGGDQPGSQGGDQPGSQGGDQPGSQGGGQAGQSSNQAGGQGGGQPGSQGGGQPGSQPGTQAGGQAGTSDSGRGTGSKNTQENGSGQGRGAGAGEEAPKGRRPSTQSDDSGEGVRPSSKQDEPGAGRRRGGADQPITSGTFTDDGGTVSGSTRTAGGGGDVSFQGGSGQLRSWDSPFTEAQITAAVLDVEATAAGAIEAGVRTKMTPESLGNALQRPLDGRPATKQRYRTPDGRVETVTVATPKNDNTRLQAALDRRRPNHKQVAKELAKQLKAIRQETMQRLRQQREGRLDRRRFVPAVKGAQDVKTQTQELPATTFAASVAVDLSDSMDKLVNNASLYDASMILNDTFDMMDIPSEVRGFGRDAVHFRSMGDPTFDPTRAAMLGAATRGGTRMADTAGLGTQALRARAEKNKLFVALSDGDLQDHEATVAILKEARRIGVVTFGIYLGTDAKTQKMDELYGPGNWVQINDLKDFPVTVGRRVAQIFKQLR